MDSTFEDGWMDNLIADSTTQDLILSVIILSIGILIIVTNVIILGVNICQDHGEESKKEVLTYYLLSLAISDLLAGVIIVPLSVYPMLLGGRWVYGDFICKSSGYLSHVLWTVQIFTLMWMAVDRYVAVRKPIRYETVQTRTRVLCWISVSWVSSCMLCCPPMLGISRGAEYDKNASVCFLDWNVMPAYALTLSALILGPTVVTILYCNYFIICAMKSVKSDLQFMDKEYVSALTETLENPAHITSFILVVFFWISWLPFLVIKFFESLVDYTIQVPYLHFTIFWMGLGNSFWKLIIYVVVNRNFRFQLKIFCLSLCCRNERRTTNHRD